MEAKIDKGRLVLSVPLGEAHMSNGGKMMLPHVLSEVRDSSNRTVRTFHPSVWRVTMRPDTAATLTQYMIDVVQRGTGTAGSIATSG